MSAVDRMNLFGELYSIFLGRSRCELWRAAVYADRCVRALDRVLLRACR